jgi:hypothetical protein
MTLAPAFRRFAVAFSTVFGLAYAITRARALALFTVYPLLGIVLPGMHRSRDVADPAMEFLAPEMWWYGWTATATLGALVIGLLAAMLPECWSRWFWPGWAAVGSIFAMMASVYLTIPWFRQ